MKNIIKNIFIFIILILFFYSCSCERKEKRYAIPDNITNNNKIVDYINNKNITNIIYIGLNILELDSVNINLLYLPNSLKFTYINHEPMIINAMIIENFENNYNIFINESSINSPQLITYLSHELIHLKQKKDKRLIIKYGTGVIIFDNKMYLTTNYNYNQRPWEIEAFEKQNELKYKINQELIKFQVQP